MCGFIGELRTQPGVNRPDLYRRNNRLIHRGPDESAIFVAANGKWGVAHRRLCVLDPEGGKQPMRDSERCLTLVLNGEIYDHERLRGELSAQGYRFQTRSDTEVLLALYAEEGLELFPRLRGEFAFALVDERNRIALLARDRLGLKPLYYTQTSNAFVFASEIKALLATTDVKREICPTGLLAALSLADLPGETLFAGIRQVRHAHYLLVNLDSLAVSEHCYWDAWEAAQARKLELPTDSRGQLDAVREEVDTAIRLRLCADAPVGAYLSGGLDSSLVTCRMAQWMDRVDAFALAFEESARHDEYHFAQQVAQRYPNIDLHRIPVNRSNLLQKLPDTVWHLERPFGNLHSVAKLLAAQYARDYVVCVLTGDGGDEAFCGYSTHQLQAVLQDADYSLAKVRAALTAMKQEAWRIGGNRYYLAGGLARQIGPETQFLQDRLGFRPADLATAVDTEARLRPLLHPDFRRRINDSPVSRLTEQLAQKMPSAQRWPHATLLQYVQLNSSVPEYIATIADRTESAGSVEARPPLFDHRVVELALALPLEMKLLAGREKYALREAYRDDLPTSVIERRKQAFLAPPTPFVGPIGRMLLDQYLDPKLVKAAGIWSPRKIAALQVARRLFPYNRIVNLVLTIVITTQILHEFFIEDRNG